MATVSDSCDVTSTQNEMGKFSAWPTDPCSATVTVTVDDGVDQIGPTVGLPALNTSYDPSAKVWHCDGSAQVAVGDVQVQVSQESTGIYLFLYNATGQTRHVHADMSGTTTPAPPPPPPPPPQPPGGRWH